MPAANPGTGLMAQDRSIRLQPPQARGDHASTIVLTCAQLHVLADQIRALRQVCLILLLNYVV